MVGVFDLWGQRGWGHVEVAGESHHQAEIRQLFGRRDLSYGAEFAGVAQLVPEPGNRFDRHAVRVEVEGKLVGYLPKEVAATYAPVLSRVVRGGAHPQCGVRVWADNDTEVVYDRRGGSREIVRGLRARVTLDLAEPHVIVPRNPLPAGSHVMLPTGSTVRVSSSDANMTALKRWAVSEGASAVHLTLARYEQQLARSSRSLGEVSLDDVPVGRLTPKMSEEFLPIVDQLATGGALTVCRGLLRGNDLKMDVALQAAKASQLPDRWLADVRRRFPPRTEVATPKPTAPTAKPPAAPSTPTPAAGWYADPQEMAPLRYWDGNAWTSRVKAR